MQYNNLDSQTMSQLKVLNEISVILEKLEFEFWLKGGWAIDFLLGKVTRTHADIDLVTWIENRDRIENELLRVGFKEIPVKEEFRKRQADFRKDNVDVTFGYITYNSDGSLIKNGLPEWEWRKDSLLSQRFLLHGISAQVIHPKQLLEEKEVYEQIGRPYRQKDAESKKILHQIISNNKFEF